MLIWHHYQLCGYTAKIQKAKIKQQLFYGQCTDKTVTVSNPKLKLGFVLSNAIYIIHIQLIFIEKN